MDESKKNHVWKSFLILLKDSRLPWLFIIFKLLLSMGVSQLSLIFPDMTAQILAGDLAVSTITLMVSLMFLQYAATGVSVIVGRMAGAKITLSLRKFMLRKVLSLPIPFYDNNMPDRLISRTTEDTQKLSSYLGDDVPNFPSQIYLFLGTLFILFRYDWRLVALTAVTIPVILLLTFVSGRLGFKWNNRIQIKLAELTGYLAEILANIPLLKVFVQEVKEDQKGQDNIEELYKTKVKYQFITAGLTAADELQGIVTNVVAIVGGAWLVTHEYITLEIWMAYYLYTGNLSRGITEMKLFWERTKAAQGAARRMSEIAMEQDETAGGNLDLTKQDGGDLCFKQVGFSYGDTQVLRDMTFTIPANKVTAFVGKSGAGKSTVFGLLERFYDPDSGRITMGGESVDAYSLRSWRQAIGYVPQETQLLSGTIRSNITYGLERQVTEEEIIRAAKAANAYDFIMEQKNGFDTETGERGSKLSGGQCQRIAIARALLKDPKILLLDEVTSSLDAEAKAAVEEALERLKDGRTTIMIAHDLSTVRDADQIIVLDDRTVEAAGTHEELIQTSPVYQSLLRAAQPAAL